MQAQYLITVLPINLVKIINDYLFVSFNDLIRNINKQMPAKIFDRNVWESLLQYSRDVKVVRSAHPHYTHYNLAKFLQNFIRKQVIPEIVPYIQNICYQIIKKDPEIIHNCYELQINFCSYVPYPTYELMSTYLINRTVDKQLLTENNEKQEAIFHIFQYIVNNHFIDDCSKFFDCLRPGRYLGSKVAQTVSIILSYPQSISTKIPVQNLAPIRQRNIYYLSLFKSFLQDILQKYGQNQEKFRKNYKKSEQEDQKQKITKDFIKMKKNIQQILALIGTKNCEFISNYEEQIKKCIYTNVKVFKLNDQLMSMQNYRRILFSSTFIYQIFANRKVQWIKLLWEEKQLQNKIGKLKSQGKNLLQVVCSSYGLTHNIIILLWQTGLFEKMPKIQNEKSRIIIIRKYKSQNSEIIQ